MQHPVHVLTGARPAAEGEIGLFRRRALDPLQIGRHVGQLDLGDEAGVADHLRQRLHDALVEGGRGRERYRLARGARLLDQRLRRVGIVGIGLDALDIAEVRRRRHLGERFVVTAENTLDDAFLVDGLRDRLAHALVVQRPALRVELEIADALGQHR